METRGFSPEEQQQLKRIYEKKAAIQSEIANIQNELRDIVKRLEALDLVVDGEDPMTVKRNLGIKAFNFNPKKGIEYLCSQRLLQKDADEVAKFLLEYNSSLNKKNVGEYLGEISKEFNSKVLQSFMRQMHFHGMDIVAALRKLFAHLQPAGEGQKIDKLLEVFGQRFYEDNPSTDVLISPNECHIFAFSIIMVNTSLHNPRAKSQTAGFKDEQSYISGLADYGDKLHVPEAMIRRVFQEIKNNPIEITTENISDIAPKTPNAKKRGYLWKLGGRVKNWKRRWFVLAEHFLIYYVSEDAPLKGLIPLVNVGVRACTDRHKEFCFELYPTNQDQKFIKAAKSDATGKNVEGRHTVYRISAASAEERTEWMNAIQKSICNDL